MTWRLLNSELKYLSSSLKLLVSDSNSVFLVFLNFDLDISNMLGFRLGWRSLFAKECINSAFKSFFWLSLTFSWLSRRLIRLLATFTLFESVSSNTISIFFVKWVKIWVTFDSLLDNLSVSMHVKIFRYSYHLSFSNFIGQRKFLNTISKFSRLLFSGLFH